MISMDFNLGAVVEFHLSDGSSIHGEVIRITRKRVDIVPQFFVSKITSDHNRPALVATLKPLQTIGVGPIIHIDRKAIVWWHYWVFPSTSEYVNHRFVISPSQEVRIKQIYGYSKVRYDKETHTCES